MATIKKDVRYVSVQILLFAIYILDVEMHAWSLPYDFFSYLSLTFTFVGIAVIFIAVLQLNTNLSPFPSPTKDSQLIKNGVYAWVRHPIYTGILFTTFGYGMYRNSEWKILIAMILVLLFHFKARYEESLLIKRFEKDYLDYIKSSGRFLPPFGKLS